MMITFMVIKDDDKFYPQLFLEEALFLELVWHPTRWWDWCMLKK